MDYLLKPFDEDRFRAALDHVRERLTGHRDVAALLDALAPKPRYAARLVAPAQGRLSLVTVDEIEWIEGADNYVRLHTGSGAHLLRETLRNLESRLDPACFARVHRSTIVNLSRVKEMLALPSGDYTVVLEGGTRLTLSRGYRRGFEEQIGRTLG